MNNITHIQKKKGFSLLETIVYVTILAVLLVVVVNTLLIVGRAYGTVSASRALNRSTVAALDRITHEIRQATSISGTGTVFGSDPSVVTLDSAGVQISIGVNNGVLQITEDGITQDITADDVTVTSFIAEQIITGRSDGVKMTIGMAAGEGNQSRSETFYISALLRGGY